MKKFFIWILIVVICIFSINIVVFFLDIGLGISKFMPKSLINVFIDSSRTFDIPEFIDLWFSFIGILVTAVLSYLLLKVSQKSNNISEQISNLEKNRDKQLLNDNIATIYYQTIYSIRQLHNLYIAYFINGKTPTYTNIKLYENWVVVLGSIQSKLSVAEIDILYQFFIDIENLNDDLSHEKQANISNIYKKIMLPCYFDSPKMFDLTEIDPITMLKPKFLSILLSLFFALKKDSFIYNKNNNVYTIYETDDNSFNGNVEIKNNQFDGKIELNYNNIKVNAKYLKNKFRSGTIKAYYDNTWKVFYEIDYKSPNDFDAKFFNSKLNSCTGEKIIDADYKNFEFQKGYLKFYKRNELWDGVIKRNDSNYEMIDGIIHHRLVEDSEGYNYDVEQEQIARYEELQNDSQYQEYLAVNQQNYEDEVGYEVYEDFMYENGEVIKRINRRTEEQYSCL
ncbi:MAG: hypothetical protein IKD04_04695 [Clostridia bacterium]|nr:hypothetical protein [Clostridia bacterium]